MIDEERIAYLMKSLGITREEAIELEEYDDDVNKGKKTEHDLPPEKMKYVQEMTRRVEHRKYGSTHRERKPNDLKIAIMAELAEFLREDAQGQAYEDVELTNISRMMHFRVGDKEFDLQLIEKRPPKK